MGDLIVSDGEPLALDAVASLCPERGDDNVLARVAVRHDSGHSPSVVCLLIDDLEVSRGIVQ